MAKRMDALVRIFALLWVYTVGSVIATVIAIVGILYMIVDVAWQLLLGSEGLSATSTLGSWINGTFMWGAGQTNYALTGSGSFKWLPSPA